MVRNFSGQEYDKTQQPKGDPDCKLGYKENANQRSGKQSAVKAASADASAAGEQGAKLTAAGQKTHDGTDSTPTNEGMPASKSRVGTFYWGYASGVVATKVDGWGEFVLAEMTQTFNQSDLSYFQPLMAQTETALGYKPHSGALDAAFDAHHVYAYFNHAHGFAAVPLRNTGHHRDFDDDGNPICDADLSFTLKRTYTKRANTLIPHQRQKYVCPLLYPEKTGASCPIAHQGWAKGGCQTDMAASIGARIRYQIDRDGDAYKTLYKQRTATERINSQALALGIERPKLRNKQSITNQNTLIYVLINLRALQRIKEKKAQNAATNDR